MSISDDLDKWRERIGGGAVLVSILLHVLLGFVLWAEVLWPSTPEEPTAIEVEIAPQPPAPPLPKIVPPKPPEQAQTPPPEPKTPEPKPPEPKPEPEAKAVEQPKAQPRSMPPPIKPGPKPVMEPGKLAKESHESKHNWLDDVGNADSKTSAPSLASLMSRPTESMAVSNGGHQEDTGGPATQSERDFLLSQILTKWKRPFGTWPPDAVVRLRVRVQADGYFAPPFNAHMPYSPASAIAGYEQMGRGDPRLAVLETLYVAIRVAQPLTLAVELRAKAPFEISLDFKLADVD